MSIFQFSAAGITVVMNLPAQPTQLAPKFGVAKVKEFGPLHVLRLVDRGFQVQP